MQKVALIFYLIIIIGTQSCTSTMAATTPEPVPIAGASSTPEQENIPVQSPVAEQETVTQPSVSVAPSGLRVVYIRDGNLWSWTEVGGAVQLTDTGDMTAARVSTDGELLAFMRGHEIWTVRMDGMDARLLNTKANEGGALWFAPDSSLLAVSTKDHVEVINLVDSSFITVVNYPALPDGYFPEVIWSPDGMGFKTVIPSQSETGQAELLFVFTNGTVASLAKFPMVSISESLPYISSDGGYIIYVAKLGESKESLYLMDSSGATRAYGEQGKHIRACGWLPDSKHFAYGDQVFPKAFLGNIGGLPTEIGHPLPATVRWVTAERYLGIENGDLMIGALSGDILLIDSNVQDFDFVP